MENLEKYTHNVGETVVYRKQGIYEITEIKEQKIGNINKEYYVLGSVYDKNATVYVPVDNTELTSQMKCMLSKDEIFDIINKSEENKVEWIENNTERAIYFDEIIKSGELFMVLSMLKLFMLRKENADKKSSRTFARDEKAFDYAMKIITEAFAYPLGIQKTEVISYITDRVKSNK